MGQKDLTEKNFLIYQDIYADTLNAFVWNAMSEEEKGGNITMCELLDKYENRGIQKGIQKGIRQAESRYAALTEKLINTNRIDDLRKAAHSRKFRNQLYKEFELV